MISRKILFQFLLIALFTGIISGQNNNTPADFSFIQMTDPQFGMFESDKGFAKETELYEKAVNEINRLNPDFVVITGDLVNKKDDKTQIAEFKRITGKIKPSIPVYYSPGNHDIGQSPTQQDINSFISEYGSDKFSFRHKGFIFIGINSCIIKANTPLLEKVQFEWLKKELTERKGADHAIVFCHYPFFINNSDEAETYSNIPLETRNKYLTLFKENNVDAVFAGHLHDNASSKYGNMEMITTSAVGKPLAKAPSGFRIVQIRSGRVESVYYGLDEIPLNMHLNDNQSN
jgi:3',5'-cyclic AMP phosphodiesterase CpdA